ncbi:M14 family metallopeptidase [Pseudoalteromonas carrageenovora]|uniref:M14 metallopeptidase family protein n=1 Tax=Pseudoalteromonas carrageenovora TaxID=227 RepID=UPI0021198C2C|nr:M14 metallopeptidase family protein [Pseudoalteromonas carrageenovora]MCQ8891378.1 M14 family metallopeptidase [Pseudoalteromonas carrageenovora]
MRWIITIMVAMLSFSSMAKPLSYYFEQDVKFDPAIPTPEQVLGYEVGQWHVRHDQLVRYMEILADKSDRINFEVIGRTHEQRPLVMLTITAADKLTKIEQIRQDHLARLDNKTSNKTNSQVPPSIVWMGYSVHGNESSGSNSALLVAYYLAAAQGAEIEELLNSTVILLDPSLNPDGLARFANWANSNRGMNLSSDPKTREHVEGWPSSRTNHYWFDLNRDWLLLQHPESRARIAKFHTWKPNILTDFHEMGPNSSYFFQPGIPSRKHPITPDENVSLTKAIANYHAKTLDENNALYFTEESFDDFYYGKGSTYPDVNGGVGILFEQASSRGHVQETINGTLTFPFTIKNQLLTSLSTFKAAVDNRVALLEYQAQFYNQAIDLAKEESFEGYVVEGEKDNTRIKHFLGLLKQHQIDAFALTKPLKAKGKNFTTNSYFIPLAQPQYRLIKAIFSEQKNFADNTFYDVSGWTLAHAFNLPFAEVKSSWGLKIANTAWKKAVKPSFAALKQGYAFGFSWDDYLAPKMLNSLLKQGIKARVALSPLKAKTPSGEVKFDSGSIIVPAGLQTNKDWVSLLNNAQNEFGIAIKPITSGLTSEGADLGSRTMAVVNEPKVLLIGGKGISQYEAGEVWYYLDRFVGVAPTIVEMQRLSTVELSNYSHIVLAHGNYSSLSDAEKVAIKTWVRKGGVIWGHKGGAKFLADQQLLKASYLSRQDVASAFNTQGLNYADKDHLAGRQRIAGAIFNTNVDLTHPLTFSLKRETLPVFKNSTWLLEASQAPFVNILTYTKKPLLAGFTDAVNVEQVAGGAGLIAHSYGRGTVIGMTDDPVFRGYWYGTSRLLSNALFFGHTFRVNGG